VRDPDLTSSVDGSYRGKRLFDLTLVGLAAIPAGALGLVIAAAIRLTSEMSIVGPRPTCDETTARYTADQWRRVSVRPGVTGLAQVSGRNHLATLRAALGGHGAELPDDRDSDGYWLGPSESPLHEGER
jgi:lipopolysaccharide/colanic/teichoic acid biosynthesis glycosyltransferase